MKQLRILLAASLSLGVAISLANSLPGVGWTYFHFQSTGSSMTAAADKYLATLTKEQKEQSLLDYDTPKRVGWHFIPKDERKGLQVKQMKDGQRKAAHALLRSCLSEAGYTKATKIMALETVLHELEKNKRGGNIRDPERYYFTLFGEPSNESRWGLSIEGHHLSLNFVVENDKVISSTPAFFAANPGIVKNEVPAALEGVIEKGERVLAKEELLAFELVNSLDEEQQKVAVIAEKAPREIRAAGEPQPPTAAPEGLPVPKLTAEQKQTLRRLVHEYAQAMPATVAEERMRAIVAAGPEKIHFAWAGSLKPGVGHYYRVQGPTFLIEFVNTQPDAAGNPANHIHCVWRDPQGDFAIPIAKK